MTTTVKFPVPRSLEENETAVSLGQWKNQFLIYAQRDPTFEPFLKDSWDKSQEHMGLRAAGPLSPEQRAVNCELFINHVSSFLKTPFWNHRLLNRTKSIKDIWKIFDEIFGIETTADSFLDLSSLKHNGSESYSSFLARIMYHLENHLPSAGTVVDGISAGLTGEKMSIMVMDMAVWIWLEKINPVLVDRVKIEYGVQIKQGFRISALAPQIAKAIPSILKKVGNTKNEVIRALKDIDRDAEEEHTPLFNIRNQRGGFRNRGASRGSPNMRQRGGSTRGQYRPSQGPICRHCNWLKEHWNIHEIDVNHRTDSCRRTMPPEVKFIYEAGDNHFFDTFEEEDEQAEEIEGNSPYLITKINNGIIFQKTMESSCNREDSPKNVKDMEQTSSDTQLPRSHSRSVSEIIASMKLRAVTLNAQASSPKMKATHDHGSVIVLIDEGSELNAICEAYAKKHNIQIVVTSRGATAAGNNKLDITGESKDDFILDTKFGSKHYEINLGRVTIVPNLGSDVIMGEPGKAQNGISTDPQSRKVFINRHGEKLSKDYYSPTSTTPGVCRISSDNITVFPEGFISLDVPEGFQHSTVAITPRREYSEYFSAKCMFVEETFSMQSISPLPVNLRRNAHIFDVRMTREVSPSQIKHQNNTINLVHMHSEDDFKYLPTAKTIEKPDPSLISVDPDNIMPEEAKEKFHNINERFADIFTPTPGRYNGAYGPVDNSLRFSTQPVQTSKVTTANYSEDMNDRLRHKMDELIEAGVLIRPEELGVTVEFLSPCLLVPKQEKDSWRLVTDFTQLNRHLKRHPSSNPTINDAKVDLTKKKYRAELDLSNYFFQHGLKRGDAAYLGVQHPTRGIYVYASSPQGLMNSSELAYDLLGRIYGDMIETGQLTRLADSIYPLGDSFEELALNYAETLRRAEISNLTFKPQKTVICPESSVIFGWRLSKGKWCPQDHVVSSLTRADKPKTYKQLRSFLGAYKQINSCIKGYAVLLSPFEKILGSRGSAERIVWTEDLTSSFEALKAAAADPSGIYVPRRDDRLITASDYSKAHSAIGGVLKIMRKEDNKEVELLGGHYSASLDKDQRRWLTCECEALAAKKVLQHFEPEIRNSDHETLHLCDNMPTVLAWRKLLIGKFSTNPRITTFLSALATHPVRLEHRPGSSLHLADHASRHPARCSDKQCSICDFVSEDTTVMGNLEGVRCVEEELQQTAPFLQIPTWLDIQRNDSTHTRLVKLIESGQSPERKRTGGEETVLKHLHTMFTKGDVKVHSSGLVLVRAKNGFMDNFAISVPTKIFPGLVFAFHHKTNHPKKSQMFKLLSRYYYTSGMQNVIDKVSDSCLQCMSTKRLPKPLLADSTTIPTGVGRSFSSDVLERSTQRILITKDELSHFALAVLIPDQTAESLRQGLVQTIAPIISSEGAQVKVDPAPGFQSIAKNQQDDIILKNLNLKVVLGDALNTNKNPIAESAIAELKRELLTLAVHDRPIDQAILSLATHNLNMRVRAGGLSANERLMARDMMTGKPLKVDDSILREDLDARRKKQHLANTASAETKDPEQFSVGDLVMMREMCHLNKPRDLFIVAEVKQGEIWIRRSEKQWRRKLYRVKPQQLVKVLTSEPSGSILPPDDIIQPPSGFGGQPPLKLRVSPRSSAQRTKLAIQQGYKHKLTKLVRHKKKTTRYVYITMEDEFPTPNRDNLIDLHAVDLAPDLINLGSDHDTTLTQCLDSTPRSDADRDIFFDTLEQIAISPVLSPNSSARDFVRHILDSPTIEDATPVLSATMSVASMGTEDRDSLIRHFEMPSSSGTPSLAWDSSESLLALQDSNPDNDDVFTDAYEDPNSDTPLRTVDEEGSDAPVDSSHSQDDDQDLYQPEDDDQDEVSVHDEDAGATARDSISTRTRSSRSDRSPETFQRNSILRRPLVQAWNDYNLQSIDDLPSSAANRSGK